MKTALQPTMFVLAILLAATTSLAGETAVAFNPDKYFVNPVGWQATPDGFETTGRDAGDAVLRSAPICRRVTVEAEVTAQRAETDQWKVAAVAVYHDRENYWHFGIVQPPDGSGRANFCELSQMRNGVWNSHHNLKVEYHEQPGKPWVLGKAYRLRIALDPEGVEGSIHDTEGNLIERKRYRFSAPAVTAGRPALRSPGLAARFRAIGVRYSDPVSEPQVTTREFPPYESASFVPEIHGRKTGYFHVEQRDGKWWTIDPLGRGFVPLGVDHVRYTGHWCEQLGYAPYHRKMQQKYPRQEDWIVETAERLKSWGFNRLAAEAWAPITHHGLCHTRFVGIGSPMAALGDEYDITPNEGRPCSAFPNVFHPAFEAYCRYQAERACRPNVGDPWLFGYFLDNELAWWGRGNLDTGLFDAVMKKSSDHTAKRALRDFLANRYAGDVARLNAAWGIDLTAFDDLLTRNELQGRNGETAHEDKKAFLALIADRYFAITTRAIRQVDPDHMILGCRFAGGHASEVVWSAAVKHCDVLTVNYYGNVDLDRRIALDHQHSCQGEPLEVPFARFAELAQGRPLMVTEWSFIALDSGLPCTQGAGQRFLTQTERALAARIYAETLLRIPQVIGFDYFMWSDEPALGISTAFPENSNYGLVNEDNEPYEEMVAALSSVTHRAGQIRLEGPKPRPATTETKPEPVPSVAQFVAKRTENFTGEPQKPNPALHFEREDNRFRAANGRLTLEAEVGAAEMLRQIRLGDLPLGQYIATVHQWSGQSQWPRVNRLVDVQAKDRGGCLTLDLTGRFETGGAGAAQLPYEICQRVWLPPQAEWFVVELVSCRNLSEEPMQLRGIYFQFFSAIGGKADGDGPASQHRVPRLWGQPAGDAWVDADAGAYLGVAAPRGAPLLANFWLNEWGGEHPDARWEIERTLAPGETLRPAQPIYWIVLAGRGDSSQWEAQQRAIVAE